jgi:hypothetical protein
MTRFFRSWLRAVAGALPARRRFVPGLLLLEDRTLPSVQFTPAPYAVPAHRPDTPLGPMVATGLVEPYVSVSPAHPEDIAVSQAFGIRVSATAGGSFTGVQQFPGPTIANGDTVTTYDSAGRLFWVNVTGNLASISIAQVDPSTGGIISRHVVDQVPDNSFFDDKDWITVDPTNNNLYVVWDRIGPGTAHIVMRYSRDQGATWSDLVQVDNGSDRYIQFSTLAVAPDHHVYAAYHSVTQGLNGQHNVPAHDGKIVVVRFNNDLTDPVRSIAEVPGRADITWNFQNDGYARKIPGAQFETPGSTQPWVLADPVRPGNIYVISADSNNGFHQDYGDIRLARSTDYGLTWSSSLIETSSALFPNAAIDQFGDIVLAWYDNRRGLNNGAGHFKLDVYATYSTDGGLTFAPAFPVNDQTPGVNTPDGNLFDPDPGAPVYDPGPPPTTRIGEYFGTAIWGGTAYVAWNGNAFAGFNQPTGQQVWTNSFAIPGSLTVTGTPGSDYITIRSMADNPAFVEVVVNGQRQYVGLWSALTGITINATSGDDSVQIEDTAASTPVTVNLGDGTDSVNVGFPGLNLDTVQGPVTVHGGSGFDSVSLFDGSHATNATYTVTGSSVSRPGFGGLTYDHIGFMRLGGPKGTVNVRGPLPNVVEIRAAFRASLNINDQFSTADSTYSITGSAVTWTGSASVNYFNVTSLAVNGGSGDNTYNVMGSANTGPTTLNTGSGTDTVNVRGSTGLLFINSGGGGDAITLSSAAATLSGIGHIIANDPSNSATVTVDDSGFAGSTTYTATSSQVTAAAWPNFLLVYNDLASLTLKGSSGDDSFAIESTASTTATTISAGSGSNRFDLTHTDQYLADLAGPLSLLGSGADTLVFWDTANPNAETYTFDNIPSMLALATVPTFTTSWSGMAAVYLETNGLSTVNDPSGTVLVDLPPPSAPNGAQRPQTWSVAVEDSLVQALLNAARERHATVPDLLHPWTQTPTADADPPVWMALDW